MNNTVVIIGLVACIAAFIAQKVMIKSLWINKGVNLSTGRIWPVLAFLGFAVFVYVLATEVTFSELLADEIWAVAFVLISFAAFIFLLVRNIKGAGVGPGIVLTGLQTLSGVFILAIGTVKLSSKMAQAEFTSTAPAVSVQEKQAAENLERANCQREEARESQEAYAQTQGFSNAQEAYDYGDSSIDPNLL